MPWSRLETDLDPRALLQGLLRIEQEFGRDRSAGIRNGPRTLDLDILVYGDERISEPGLEIPHPRMEEREFVVIPLRGTCIQRSNGGGARNHPPAAPNVSQKVPRSIQCGGSCPKRYMACFPSPEC